MVNKAQIALLGVVTLVSSAWADSIDIAPNQKPSDAEIEELNDKNHTVNKLKDFTNSRAEFVGQADIMAKSKPDVFTKNTKDIFSKHKPDTLSDNKKDIFSESKSDDKTWHKSILK